MAGNAENFSAGIGPPRLAHALLAVSASGADKAALIGDLEEEFGERVRNSPRAARAWYWRQASLSLPHLLLERMRTEHMRRLGVATLAVLAGFVFVSLWEIAIARTAARAFSGLSETPSFGAVRMVYLGVHMLGIAAVGGAIATLIFRRDESFLRNALHRLAPAAIILFAPYILAVLDPGNNYPMSFRLLRLSLAAPSLLAGAGSAVWLYSRRIP